MTVTSIGQSSGANYRAIVTAGVMAATLMQTLDTTIVNVALPYIQGSLAVSPDQITWTLTAYIVAAAIMTPPIGWLAARFGAKRLFLISVAGFTVASMLCGTAQSLTQIVLYRALQGVFGASVVPLSQSTMLDIFPPAQRGQAMALWVMGVVVGPVLGPTLGGYLTDFYNWRWVFYINLPIGILSIAGLWLYMKDTKRTPGRHFDFVGFSVLGIGLGALQLMLDRGEFKDWFGSTEIIVYAVLCGLGFLFVHRSSVHRRSALDSASHLSRCQFFRGPLDGLCRRHAGAGDGGVARALIFRCSLAVRSWTPACYWRRAGLEPWSASCWRDACPIASIRD